MEMKLVHLTLRVASVFIHSFIQFSYHHNFIVPYFRPSTFQKLEFGGLWERDGENHVYLLKMKWITFTA